jgi:hypothetical protein
MGSPPNELPLDQTSIKVRCGNCGTEQTFKLSEVVDANVPSGEKQLVTISEPCSGCDQRIELELEVALD